MRRAGKVVAEVLDLLREAVHPDISTGELDRMAEEHIRSCGAAPAFKGYRPAPSMSPFPGDDLRLDQRGDRPWLPQRRAQAGGGRHPERGCGGLSGRLLRGRRLYLSRGGHQ